MKTSHKILFFAFIFFCTCLPACQEETSQTQSNETSTPSGTSPAGSPLVRYLALGDSYTIGESVDSMQRWPIQLAGRLKANKLEVTGVRIIAKTGWKTRELMQAIGEAGSLEGFNLVSLLIGVNDQYNAGDTAIYREEFTQVLEKAIDISGPGAQGVFVLSIPDYGVTPFGAAKAEQIAREIDQYNAINQEVSTQYQVNYFDITPISRQAANDPGLIASDTLHPSGQMYERWVDQILPGVQTQIQETAIQ